MTTTPLAKLAIDDALAQLAAKSPTPGGGAAAALVGAVGAALAGMVVSYSVGKKSLAQHETHLREAQARLERLRTLCLTLADEDAQAYALVNELTRLPESDTRRAQELPSAARAAVDVPLALQAACAEMTRICQDLTSTSNRQLRSDLAIAAVCADAAGRAAKWNVLINAPLLGEADRRRAEADSMRLDDATRERRLRVEAQCTQG